MHCFAISKKKFAITWVCEEKYGKGKNSKVPLAIAPMISIFRGAAVERVIMIPLRPKNVGPSLRRRHFAAISLPGVKSKIGQAGKICSQGR